MRMDSCSTISSSEKKTRHSKRWPQILSVGGRDVSLYFLLQRRCLEITLMGYFPRFWKAWWHGDFLIGGLEHVFFFPHALVRIFPTDSDFSEGVGIPPTSDFQSLMMFAGGWMTWISWMPIFITEFEGKDGTLPWHWHGHTWATSFGSHSWWQRKLQQIVQMICFYWLVA